MNQTVSSRLSFLDRYLTAWIFVNGNAERRVVSDGREALKPPFYQRLNAAGLSPIRSVRSRSTFSIRVHTQFRLRKFAVDSAVYELKMRVSCPARSLFRPQIRLDAICPDESRTLW